VLVVIGSSLSVYPSSEIIHYNNNIIYINPIPPEDKDCKKWNIIQKPACEGIKDLLNLIK
jgi:NAD-dependent SIR2 family protein deacetylase